MHASLGWFLCGAMFALNALLLTAWAKLRYWRRPFLFFPQALMTICVPVGIYLYANHMHLYRALWFPSYRIVEMIMVGIMALSLRWKLDLERATGWLIIFDIILRIEAYLPFANDREFFETAVYWLGVAAGFGWTLCLMFQAHNELVATATGERMPDPTQDLKTKPKPQPAGGPTLPPPPPEDPPPSNNG